MASRIVVVTGASGAGKTAVVTRLAERNLAGVTCAFFDSVGVPPPEEMPPDWQEKTTNEWIRRLARARADVAVLDGQTRPTFAQRAFAEVGVRGSVVVIHCAREVRKARLVARGQQHLIRAQCQGLPGGLVVLSDPSPGRRVLAPRGRWTGCDRRAGCAGRRLDGPARCVGRRPPLCGVRSLRSVTEVRDRRLMGARSRSGTLAAACVKAW